MVRQLSEETEMAEDSDAHNKLPLDIESQITTAMQSRVPHFKQQSEFVLLLSLSLSLCPNFLLARKFKRKTV